MSLESGEKVLYTYDTVVITHQLCHFAKRLVFLAAHPPEEHNARPSQQAFHTSVKHVCAHTNTHAEAFVERWDVRFITLGRQDEGVATVCPSEDLYIFTER